MTVQRYMSSTQTQSAPDHPHFGKSESEPEPGSGAEHRMFDSENDDWRPCGGSSTLPAFRMRSGIFHAFDVPGERLPSTAGQLV